MFWDVQSEHRPDKVYVSSRAMFALVKSELEHRDKEKHHTHIQKGSNTCDVSQIVPW